MVSNLVFYQGVLIAVGWLFLRLSGLWPAAPTAARPQTPKPLMPPRPRSTAPTPLKGLSHTPSCDALVQGVASRREPPCAPPPSLVATRGRRRPGDPSPQGCPDPACR